MTPNYLATNSITVGCAEPTPVAVNNKPHRLNTLPSLLSLIGKINVYYVLAALIIIWTARITPLCIYLAAQSRGYSAYGGEYLILPFGIVIGIVIITIGRERSRRARSKGSSNVRSMAELRKQKWRLSNESCHSREYEACRHASHR